MKSTIESDQQLEEVRNRLIAFADETFDSSRDPNLPSSELLALRESRPISHLTSLYQARDPAVIRLSGTFFGAICRYVDPAHFAKVIARDLSDPDPSVRMFACDALGELGQPEVIPLLRRLLADEAIVEGFGDGRVNLFAAFSLAWLGDSSGFAVLFDYAERHPSSWEWNVLRHFRRFSRIDCGKDLAAWRKHFAQCPPEPRADEPYYWSNLVGEGPRIPVYRFEGRIEK